VNKEDAQNLRDALEKAIQNKVLTAPKKRPMIINEEATQAEHTRINQQTSEKLIKEFIEFLNWGKFGFCFDD
jgi:hypothetical protein